MNLSVTVTSLKNNVVEDTSIQRDNPIGVKNESLLVLRKNGDKLMILKRSRRKCAREYLDSPCLKNNVPHEFDDLIFEGGSALKQEVIREDTDSISDNFFSFDSDSESEASSELSVSNKKRYSVICDICGLTFKGDNALSVHRKWKHTHVVKHECVFCCKSFRDSFCLKRHLRSVHTEDGDIRENYRSINCSLCDFKAGQGSLVSKHYASVHGYEMIEEKMRFSCVNEFESWKKEMESGTSTKFVKFRGSRTNRNGTRVTVYNCHRSGFYHAATKSKDKRLRSLKSKGSNKINGFCPATMSCIEYEGQVIVKFMMTHIGHELEVEKIGLSSNEKEFIAEKLSRSIPMDKILQDLKESGANSENKKRIHVATRKDVYNIIKKYKLKELAIYSQSKDEWKKFGSWIKELEENSNVVRFYKPQGQIFSSFSEFKTEDFCLILASDDQLELLKLYGNHCICVDNVYKENKNDFELYSLVVLDEVRESLPCIFIFSNRADDNALRVYFQVIKSILNVELCPRYFVSDWANSIFNAWTSVNKEVPCKNLFSRWHIEKEWKRNLPKIKPKEKQLEIFKKVKELLTIRNYSTFEEKSLNVLSELFNNYETKAYANYIQKIICEPSSWAYCFRLNAEVNDSLNLDELHTNIEYFYVKGKKVKCLTRTAQALMKYAETRINQRFDSSFQEKINSRINELIARHKMSLDLQESVIEITDEGWNIVSNLDGTECRNSVCREDCECNCSLVCPECMVCLHAYSCTCIDSSLSHNMCQHIHLIATCIQNHTLTENMDATAEVVEIQMVNVDSTDDKMCSENLSEGDFMYNSSAENCKDICVKCDDGIDDTSPTSNQFVAKKCEFIERLTHIVNQIETEEELDAIILQNSPLEEILQNVKEKKKSDHCVDDLLENPNKNKCSKYEPTCYISDDVKQELGDESVEEAEQIACEVIVEC